MFERGGRGRGPLPACMNRERPSLLSQTPPMVMSEHLLRRRVQGSTLVDNAGKFETLAALLGEVPESLKLESLYSTRTSSWTDAAAFHAACDHKGPTLVLIQCSDGAAYGGYTSVSWQSTNCYQADSNAFLFRVYNFANCRTKQVAEKFAERRNGHEVYKCASYGPTFGNGHDLMTFNNSGQILVCNGPSSYATPGPLIPVSVPKDPNSCHMEVLLVSEGTSSFAEQELEQAWMTGCTWSAQVMYLHWPSTQQCLVLRTLFMHLTGTADHDDGSASQWHSSCLYAT